MTMAQGAGPQAAGDDAGKGRYVYSFDLNVMHPLMIRAFEPYFRDGSLLELGCYEGDFTRRLAERFEDITCVEASEEALAVVRERLGAGVRLVHSKFEEAALAGRFDNIMMTHVLEHVADPVRVLRRVGDEWLAPRGRFFLACPNAHAASRRIAVKMGLIDDCTAVTAAEAQHGHHRTYTLDSLERDAIAAGLKVIHRSGVFFKALANFQWDRLLATDIVSREYLDGCYALGLEYPDLCASVFLVCEHGDGD